MKYQVSLSLILMVILLTLQAARSNEGIYGEDDRLEIENVADIKTQGMARATAAMIPLLRLSESLLDSDRTKISTTTLADTFGSSTPLCPGEPFANLPKAALCTGFLIKDNLLVTAGHCIRTELDCAEQAWVFDFNGATLAQTSERSVPSENVFTCKKIVRQVLERGSWYEEGNMDYAVIELNHKVRNRNPLKIRQSGSIQVGTPLVAIGHPSGLPTMITTGFVRDISQPEYFQTNLDTYGGNSGSPVINSLTGVVEGILVRGGDDYELNSKDHCVANVRSAENGGPGESVTRITAISDLVSKSRRGTRFRIRSTR